ncbi:hypothetical protein HMPREF1370_02773 [Enterococcus faecium P1123]|nr:hypothetical protein HMPREF1370_02773 [Enterococcus faecium P1123]
MIFENGSGGTGRMAEENKVVPFETLVINKEEFEQLFLDFFIQYDMIYDFSSSLDLFELEAEIIENSREKNGKIIISVEKFNELFSQTFEIDPDYYQPQEVFREFRNKIIGFSQTTK